MSSKRYNWVEVQAKYDELKNGNKTIEYFGMSNKTWHIARLDGRLITKPDYYELDEIFCENPEHKLSNEFLKKKILRHALLEYKCSECKLETWLNKPISLQLDHINGIKKDCRIENLRFLCPNCHSQTPTFGSKNWAYQKTITFSSNR